MKRVLLLLVLVGLGSVLAAQHKSYVGVRGGVQLTNADISHNFYQLNIRNTYTVTYHTGLVYKYYNKKNVGLITGLDYSVKGWTQNFFELYPNYTARLDYLELPLLMTAYLGNGRTKYFVALGPFFEYLVNYKLDPEPVETEPFDWYTYDPDRDNNFGYGLRMGGGVSHDFSFGQIHLEGFFTYSLSNIMDPVSRDSGVPDISNSFVFGASLAYLIPFGKLELYP